MRRLILKQLAILAVAFVGLNGCVSAPVSRVVFDNYSCPIPPPHILSSVGVEASISGDLFGKTIPKISLNVGPKVVETGGKALQNMIVSDYVTCRLINQYNIPHDQILPLKQFYLAYANGMPHDQFMQYINDKPSLKQIVTSVNEEKSFPGAMNGKRLYVDAVRHGSSSRDGWTKGQKITLQAGNWEIKPVGGGWSAWPSDSSTPPDAKGAWTWFMYVTMDNNSRKLGSYSWDYKSLKEADAAAAGIEPLNFSLDKPTEIFLWTWDDGGVDNNRGVLIVDVIRK